MVRSWWLGPLVMTMAGGGTVWAQSAPERSGTAGATKERFMTVTEQGKTPCRCRILQAGSLPDGSKVYLVSSVEDGHRITVVQPPRKTDGAVPPTRFYHWTKDNTPPAGVPALMAQDQTETGSTTVAQGRPAPVPVNLGDTSATVPAAAKKETLAGTSPVNLDADIATVGAEGPKGKVVDMGSAKGADQGDSGKGQGAGYGGGKGAGHGGGKGQGAGHGGGGKGAGAGDGTKGAGHGGGKGAGDGAGKGQGAGHGGGLFGGHGGGGKGAGAGDGTKGAGHGGGKGAGDGAGKGQGAGHGGGLFGGHGGDGGKGAGAGDGTKGAGDGAGKGQGAGHGGGLFGGHGGGGGKGAGAGDGTKGAGDGAGKGQGAGHGGGLFGGHGGGGGKGAGAGDGTKGAGDGTKGAGHGGGGFLGALGKGGHGGKGAGDGMKGLGDPGTKGGKGVDASKLPRSVADALDPLQTPLEYQRPEKEGKEAGETLAEKLKKNLGRSGLGFGGRTGRASVEAAGVPAGVAGEFPLGMAFPVMLGTPPGPVPTQRNIPKPPYMAYIPGPEANPYIPQPDVGVAPGYVNAFTRTNTTRPIPADFGNQPVMQNAFTVPPAPGPQPVAFNPIPQGLPNGLPPGYSPPALGMPLPPMATPLEALPQPQPLPGQHTRVGFKKRTPEKDDGVTNAFTQVAQPVPVPLGVVPLNTPLLGQNTQPVTGTQRVNAEMVRATVDQNIRQLRESGLPSEREKAIDELAQVNLHQHTDAASALLTAAFRDPALTVRLAAIRTLGEKLSNSPQVSGALRTLLEDGDARIRAEAELVLTSAQSKEASGGKVAGGAGNAGGGKAAGGAGSGGGHSGGGKAAEGAGAGAAGGGKGAGAGEAPQSLKGGK